jgi:hypothetical protein
MTDARRGAAVSAPALLKDRLLTVAGSDAELVVQGVDASRGGLVVSGASSLAAVQRLRAGFPDLVLIPEPDAHTRRSATPEAPFGLPQADGLFGVGLGEALDAQRAAGASVALTPTQFITAGDAPSLKAAVQTANRLDRQDALLLLPVAWPWVRDPDVRQLVAAMLRSRHPVALALGADADPLDHKGVPDGLRRLAGDVAHLVLWRTDLTAFDALSRGALSAASSTRCSWSTDAPSQWRTYSLATGAPFAMPRRGAGQQSRVHQRQVRPSGLGQPRTRPAGQPPSGG